MQPLNPIISRAVIDDIGSRRRQDVAYRAGERRQSRLGGLRERLAARRASPPAPSPAPRVTPRPGRA